MPAADQKTILLVEDEALIAMAEAQMLSRHGYQVVTAYSGEQAVGMAATRPEIDLVLMDIDLGKGRTDGTQAAEQILLQRDVPLIFLSSHTESEVVEKTEGITSYGYIVKHSGETVLLASIKMAFRLFEARLKEKAKDEALRESEERLRLTMDATQDGLWDWNIVTDEVIYSPAYWVMLGYEPIPGESTTKLWLERIHPDDREATLQANLDCIENRREAFACEFRMRSASGEWRWIHGRGKVVARDASGRATRLVGTHTDITERKRAEEALEKRILALTRPLEPGMADHIAFEDMFNLADIQRMQDEFSNATGVASIITHPDGTPITRPSNFCRLCIDLIRQTEQGRLNCYHSDAVLGRSNPAGPTIQPCMSGGLWDAGAGISVGGQHVANWLIGQVRDETQTEEKIRAYARQIGLDEDVAAAAFGEVTAMSHQQFERVSQALYTLASQLSNSAYQNVQQARFITERRQAEAALEKALQEKQALLKELQHRAKNSFNMIDSMINLMENSGEFNAAGPALAEIGSRVRAMAELYDLLYDADAVSAVRLDDYCTRITASFHISSNIVFRESYEAVTTPVKTAAPVGLVVTELITNAIKHAFPGGMHGTIWVRLQRSEAGAVIEVEDDGVGLPDGFDLASSDSLGLRMTRALVMQIRGSFQITSAQGTCCRVMFQVGEEDRSRQ